MAVLFGCENTMRGRLRRAVRLMSPAEWVAKSLLLILIIGITFMSLRTIARMSELDEGIFALRQRRSDAVMQAVIHHQSLSRGVNVDDFTASRLELENSRLRMWDTAWFTLLLMQTPVGLALDRYFRRRRSTLDIGP